MSNFLVTETLHGFKLKVGYKSHNTDLLRGWSLILKSIWCRPDNSCSYSQHQHHQQQQRHLRNNYLLELEIKLFTHFLGPNGPTEDTQAIILWLPRWRNHASLGRGTYGFNNSISQSLGREQRPPQMDTGAEFAKKIGRSRGWCCNPELVTSEHHLPASAKSEGKRGECACQNPDPESSRTGVVDKGCDVQWRGTATPPERRWRVNPAMFLSLPLSEFLTGQTQS